VYALCFHYQAKSVFTSKAAHDPLPPCTSFSLHVPLRISECEPALYTTGRQVQTKLYYSQRFRRKRPVVDKRVMRGCPVKLESITFALTDGRLNSRHLEASCFEQVTQQRCVPRVDCNRRTTRPRADEYARARRYTHTHTHRHTNTHTVKHATNMERKRETDKRQKNAMRHAARVRPATSVHNTKIVQCPAQENSAVSVERTVIINIVLRRFTQILHTLVLNATARIWAGMRKRSRKLVSFATTGSDWPIQVASRRRIQETGRTQQQFHQA
jgi:hypothetical protein